MRRIIYGLSYGVCTTLACDAADIGRPRWFGLFLMNVGEFGNFLSYAYAPASVVAPLGTVRGSGSYACFLSNGVSIGSFDCQLLLRTVDVAGEASQSMLNPSLRSYGYLCMFSVIYWVSSLLYSVL